MTSPALLAGSACSRSCLTSWSARESRNSMVTGYAAPSTVQAPRSTRTTGNRVFERLRLRYRPPLRSGGSDGLPARGLSRLADTEAVLPFCWS